MRTTSEDYSQGLVPVTSVDSNFEYYTVSYRWVILFCFSTLTFGNAFLWITFSPINYDAARLLGCGNDGIKFLSITYMITYFPGTALAFDMVNRKGLRFGLLFGVFATIAGAWIRFAGVTQYAVVLAGQTLSGMGQPVILNAPAMISAAWFAERERSFATSVAYTANVFGVGIGMLLPPFVMEMYPNSLYELLLIEALVATVLVLPMLFLFKESPKVPPSASSVRQGLMAEQMQLTLKSSIFKLLKNCNFMLLACIFGISVGSFTALASLIDRIIGPYDPDSKTYSGVVGMLSTFAGVLSTPLLGLMFRCCHPPWHRTALFLLLLCTMGCLILVAFILQNFHGLPVFLAAAFVLINTLNGPVAPICFELGADITYPVSEDLSGGFLMCLSQLASIIFTLMLASFIDAGHTFGGLLIISGFAGISCLLVLVFRQTNVRLQWTKVEFE